MKIIAKTIKNKEFIYSQAESYRVAADKAAIICDAINRIGWKLEDGECWHIYDISKWELEYIAAACQRLTVTRTGKLKAIYS